EDLRADRQPEFTQIDCEMSFVEMDDVLGMFEGLVRHLYRQVMQVDLGDFVRMDYKDAMELYGSDKPDLRFGMPIADMTSKVKGRDFRIFDDAEFAGALCVEGCAEFSRKQLDELTDFVRRPQIGASGMVYVKCNTDGTFKSSVDKFYGAGELEKWAHYCKASPGDLLLILSGEKIRTQKALGELRLELGRRLQLITSSTIVPLWITAFPLFERDEEADRWTAMHHPFTAPAEKDIPLLDSDPGLALANAYDMVINGIEVGGGSIRIHERALQEKVFELLGFSPEDARKQFGFLMDAFEYGAPPHGGIAFGFDRLVALFGGTDSIRDYIAFPKNNAGRDLMIDSPSALSDAQLNELFLTIRSAADSKP
ncbi:MAG: aspartate--tRNA ligase, partial [Flavobacteriales bacterium]